VPCSGLVLLLCFHHLPAHGTFVGTMRLEARKPTQLPLDTTISFGASTRSYTLRERPQVSLNMAIDNEGSMLEEGEGGTLLGLQDLDNEIDVSSCRWRATSQTNLRGIVKIKARAAVGWQLFDQICSG